MEKEFHRNGLTQMYYSECSFGLKVEGFINVLNEEHYIQLYVEDKNFSKKISLKGTWKFQKLLSPVLNTLKQHLAMCSSPVEMLKEIKITAEQQLQTQKITFQLFPPPFHYYEIVMKHLKQIGWNNIHSINEELNVIELKAIDECLRCHILKIFLSNHFPNEAPTYKYDLPEEFDFKWNSDKTLLDVQQYFQAHLSKYADLWTWLEELDEYTWVLEPENPDRSSCKRRVAITPNASILVILNPDCPSAVPICNFLGPESIVGRFRRKFRENVEQWEESLSLLTNLKIVLEIDFPSPQTSAKEEFCIECGICYSHELDGKIPDIICKEEKCQQIYHHSCLYEWLKGLPQSKQSFNTVFGDCLYCSKPIWCSMHPG